MLLLLLLLLVATGLRKRAPQTRDCSLLGQTSECVNGWSLCAIRRLRFYATRSRLASRAHCDSTHLNASQRIPTQAIATGELHCEVEPSDHLWHRYETHAPEKALKAVKRLAPLEPRASASRRKLRPAAHAARCSLLALGRSTGEWRSPVRARAAANLFGRASGAGASPVAVTCVAKASEHRCRDEPR